LPYEIIVDEARRIVVVVIVGAVDVADVAPLAKSARGAAREHGFNILYDGRRAVAGDMNTADLFWFPRNIPELSASSAGRVRTALLHLPEQRAMSEFWENAFNNAGLQARAFEDEGEAAAWLQEA